MRFLRRGGGGEASLDERLEAFWAWWASAKDDVARDIPAGRVAERAPEISKAVDRLHPKLAWELGKGAVSEHMLVVTPEGNAELRPIALAWARSAPPPDATWEYHPSRQPGPPNTLQIGGTKVDFADVRAVTSWDEAREVVSVRLWHPAFEGLPDGPRHQIAFLFLDNLVGEDDVERWIGAIDVDPSAQAGRTTDELRAEIRRRAESATGSTWALAEVTDDRGRPFLVRYNASLKRIDHPYASRHVAVVVERGLEHAGDPGLNEAINAAEEELVAAMANVAVEVAHVTDPARRITHFVTDDGERALAVARGWADRYGQWGAKATLDDDPLWEFRRSYGG